MRRRSSCRSMGVFITSPLPHVDERSTHRSGPFPPGAFCCTPIFSSTTRSATLMSAPTFPTHGYGQHLLDEISSPDIEGFSSFHIFSHTLSPLIPRRGEPPHQTLATRFLLPSRVIDRLGHRKACDEATSTFTSHCNRVRCARSFQSMLSEGSAVLLSRHGASQATRSESFDLGRTFTD